MILTDHEAKINLLNNEAITTTIIGLLRERTDRNVKPGTPAVDQHFAHAVGALRFRTVVFESGQDIAQRR